MVVALGTGQELNAVRQSGYNACHDGDVNDDLDNDYDDDDEGR